MKNLLGLLMLLIITITSCHSQSNIYKNIENLQSVYNEQNAGKSKISLGKNFKPTKTIINKLKSELKNDDIIYVFSWTNTMPIAGTNKFHALLYDINTGKSYYAYNQVGSYKNIFVEEKRNQFFKEQEYLLNHYLKMKNLDQLKAYEHQANSAEIGANYYLFDTLNKKVYNLEDLVFEEGKPAKYE